MEKKKILIIAASLRIGGAEKVARDISLYDASNQFEYHYAVFGDQIGAYEQQVLDRGCRVFHLDPPPRGHIRYFRALLELMREHHYHAVHAHNMFNCGLSMLAAKLSGVPVRITHAHSALDDGHSFQKTIYEALMRALILSCSTDLVACGEKAGIRLFGKKAYEKRGERILNGIDVDAYRFDPAKRARIRRELGLEDAFLVGHTGHLMAVKNQRFLIERMPRLLELRPDARLLLLGEGEDRSMLEEQIRSLGLEAYILMPGNVTNVSDFLSAMDIFVFPSLYEGTPLSIIEVQANGLPCVLSTGVPRDVWLTDLIRPLPLDGPEADWLDAICAASRTDPGAYADRLRTSDFDVSRAMAKIARLYRRGD